MKKITTTLAITMASLLSSTAMAQAYVSAAVGQGHLNTDCAGTTSCDNNGTAVRITGGYEFYQGISAELGYITFGKASGSVSGATIDMKAEGFTLGAAFKFPVGNDFALGGRLGVADLKTKVDGGGIVAGYSRSETKAELYAGIGVSYALTKEFSLEGNWDVSRVSILGLGTHVRALTLGARYSF